MSGKEPVEEGGARPANVQRSGGAGGKSGDNRLHIRFTPDRMSVLDYVYAIPGTLWISHEPQRA
jgi:hypothetical protein